MKSFLMAMVVLVGMGIWNCEAAQLAPPPFPAEDIRLVSPALGLPDDIKAFSGKWHGEWLDPCDFPGFGLQEILVIEEIVSPEEVKVILSWGDCPVCGAKADWRRFWGKIITRDGKKVLYFGYSAEKTFSFYHEGEYLIGTDGKGGIRMERLK
jgi:hypothetical protein